MSGVIFSIDQSVTRLPNLDVFKTMQTLRVVVQLVIIFNFLVTPWSMLDVDDNAFLKHI
jgi:hypothetical protein